MKISPLLFLSFSLVLSIQETANARGGQCFEIFNKNSYERLITQIGEFEASMIEKMSQENNPMIQEKLSHQWDSLQALIAEVLKSKGTPKSIRKLALQFTLLKLGEDAPKLKEDIHDIPAGVSLGFKTEFTGKAEKEYAELPAYLKSKVDEFLKDISQVDQVFKLPLNWHVERIRASRPIIPIPGYSARLNVGYRVFFILGPARTVQIVAINNEITHGGH
jgi:hypothetical protein